MICINQTNKRYYSLTDFFSLTLDCEKLTPNEDRVVLLSSISSLDIESSDLTSTVSNFILKLSVRIIMFSIEQFSQYLETLFDF